MDLRLDIIAGPEAWRLLQQPEFIAAWTALAAGDPKFTVYQQPPFVMAWYRVHDGPFEPVLCVGRDGSDRLAGLMPLARHRGEGRLVHAGDFHAEYHGWVARAECPRFAEDCLIALKARHGLKSWRWNFLPPGTPPGLLGSPRLAAHGIFSRVRLEHSPVWDLADNDQLERLTRNKATRNQMNRYKKKGEFRLERIEDGERARELFQILRRQNDFRQEAIHGIRPFADNPLKEPFFLERQKFPLANHFSVLFCGDKPLSFHFGPCDRGTLVLGLTAFDPIEYRNSPGKLHLVELAHLLKREGYGRIDLTPGGDPYKDYFANGSQELRQPTFYFSRFAKIMADLKWGSRERLKALLARAGLPPARARRLLEAGARLAGRLKKTTPGKIWQYLKGLLREEYTYYQDLWDPAAPLDGDDDPEVRAQHYEDLLQYDGFNPWLSRRELLAVALERFGSGETLYTICRDGRPVHYGWLTPGGKTHHLDRVDVRFRSPAKSAVLFDFFTHPACRGQGLYQRCLRQMLRDLRRGGTGIVFIGVLGDNEPSRRVIEKVGFKLWRTYRKRRRLWMCRHEEIHHECLGANPFQQLGDRPVACGTDEGAAD